MPVDKFIDRVKSGFATLKAKLGSLIKKLSEKSETEGKEKRTPLQKVLTVVGVTLCVLFSFLLICNMVIIVKGSVSPEKPPSVFGVTPMVVLSGSMSGDAEDHIEVGDLVFINKADPDELKAGDIIAFMDGKTTVTHRIIRVETVSDGDVQWITKGDANNAEDSRPVTEDNLVGIFSFRIAKLGDVAMFLQQPVGMLIVIGLPCLAFIIYDIIRRQRSASKQSEKTSEMEAELERLRKLVGAQKTAAEAESETPEESAESTEEAEPEAESEETEPEEETSEEVKSEEVKSEEVKSEEVKSEETE